MSAATTVPVPAAAWGLIFAAAVLLAVLVGLPMLLGRGGPLGGRGQGGRRGGYRVRIGPSLPVVLALALARRIDTALLALVTLAFALALVLNAQA